MSYVVKCLAWKFEGSARTLGIAYARHLMSLEIRDSALAGKNEEMVKQRYLQTELLSPQEIETCLYGGMFLPFPFPVSSFTDKYVDPDLFNLRIDREIKKHRRVYVLTGVFDTFTGGHLRLVMFAKILWILTTLETKEAVKVARGNWALTENDHWKFLLNTLVSARRGDNPLNEGVVTARLESDEYVRVFKGREVIFPYRYRLGWFEQLPVKHTTVYPTSDNFSKSWDFGNKLLAGWPEDTDEKTRLSLSYLT